MTSTEHALLHSLVHGPLLVGDLPEAATFPHQSLSVPASIDALNLQQKLGHLCESALAVLLEASPAYDLLARNLQIRSDGIALAPAHSPTQTTVGELDFLLRDLSDGQLIHLELASKFYLAVPSGTEKGQGREFALPGPDARDNYFRKIRRLREHQLILTRKHREALPEPYRDEKIVARQLIYGCLFDPVDFPATGPGPSMSSEDSTPREPALACPEFLNVHCRRGRWLSIDDCPRHFPPGTEYRIIPKELWPVPLGFLDAMPLERWTPQSPADHDRCVMLRVNGEINPYFVAPSGYPQQRA